MSEFSSLRNTRWLGGCICDFLWMEASARAASAPVKCANSFIFVGQKWICIEIVLCGRMAAHGRHVGILYTPKFSVSAHNPAASCVPEYTMSPRLLEFCTLSEMACLAKHSAQYGFGDMRANNDGKHNIF